MGDQSYPAGGSVGTTGHGSVDLFGQLQFGIGLIFVAGLRADYVGELDLFLFKSFGH